MCFSLRLIRRRPCSDSNPQATEAWSRHCETTVSLSLSLCVFLYLRNLNLIQTNTGNKLVRHMRQPPKHCVMLQSAALTPSPVGYLSYIGSQLVHLSRTINQIIHMFACRGFKAFHKILTSESSNIKHIMRLAGHLIFYLFTLKTFSE